MNRYLPFLVTVALIAAGCWSAGCTSAPGTSPSTAQATATPGPEMTTQPSGPVAPVFTIPAFGGVAEEGTLAASGTEALNASPGTPGGMHGDCPAYLPFRCPGGYCARTSAECPMSARAANCSDGTIYCP